MLKIEEKEKKDSKNTKEALEHFRQKKADKRNVRRAYGSSPLLLSHFPGSKTSRPTPRYLVRDNWTISEKTIHFAFIPMQIERSVDITVLPRNCPRKVPTLPQGIWFIVQIWCPCSTTLGSKHKQSGLDFTWRKDKLVSIIPYEEHTNVESRPGYSEANRLRAICQTRRQRKHCLASSACVTKRVGWYI